MKTFKDLEFKPKEYSEGKQAVLFFDNGYGVRVIDDGYGAGARLFELAVLDSDGVCYTTPVTNDVLGWLDKHAVSIYMQWIQSLKKENR